MSHCCMQIMHELQLGFNYTPRFNEVDRGVYWYHLVRLSVCPSVDRIVSALYLQQYSSDLFHICTSYQATSEGVSHVMAVSKFKNFKFWRIFLICNFDFVIFWLGIQYDSMVWVIMRRHLQQYSSDPFHICTSYQATSEGVSRVMCVSKLKNLKFWRIFKICNFDFVIFWLGIQYDSMVWVIMRRRGVSSERRRSSCSS